MCNRPNIVIVMTDQQRADLRRGCGYELDTMPFLDRWAEGGVDFARAYTPNPTCMPARVSMFTGRYSQSHRVRTNHNAEDALYTEDLLDVLKKAGYTTALFGKNHSHRKAEDFDRAKLFGHLGYEGEENTTPEEREFADFLRSTDHLETHRPSPGGVTVQHPYRSVSDALEFMDQMEGKGPFFAWISFAEPHNPYQAPEPYYDLFPPEALPPVKGKKEDLKGKGERFVWLRQCWEKVLGEEIDERILRARSNYLGMLRLIDDQMKRLLEGVRQRGLEENTIFLYLSDHGDFAGEYDLIRKGTELPDVLCHIPMIWRGPGIRSAGRVKDGYVSIVDILPTICDFLGIPVPFGCQGKSIRPLLEGRPLPEGGDVSCEYDCAFAESGYGGLYWGEKDHLDPVTEGATNGWKNFDCLNTWTQCGQVRALWKDGYHIQLDMMGNGYLYHTDGDPSELCNLWDEPACAQTREELLAALASEMMKQTDVIPVPHYRYRVKVHPKGFWHTEDAAEDPGVRKMRRIGQNHLEEED